MTSSGSDTRQRRAVAGSAGSSATTNGDAAHFEEKKPVLERAPPPWHAVVLITVMSGAFISTLPSLAKLDEIAVTDTFTVRLFPELISLRQLALIRAGIAAVIWGTTLYNIVSPGWEQMTPYQPGSKLKMVPNMLVGRKTLYPFTSWSWIILGVSFTLSSYIAWRAQHSGAVPVVSRAVLRAAVIAWEIAAPCTLLVAATVRYAMWPAVLKRGGSHSLNSLRNLLMHNMNVLAALTESCLLSGLHGRWSEVAVAPLWGCLYVVFSWNMTFAWNERRHGPQFIYFFFDTTVPGYFCSIALIVLLAVLITFYAAFCTTNELLAHIDGGVWTHVLFVAVTSGLVMRFRD